MTMDRFDRARVTALQDPKIKSMIKSFQQDLLPAMRKVDGRVPSLIQELQQAEASLGGGQG